MFENIAPLLGCAGTLLGFATTAYMFRRARRAEVKSKEIATADQMVDLVVKANEEVAKIREKENERLCNSIDRLEKAIQKIGTCAYRAGCPVTDSLRHDAQNPKPATDNGHGDSDGTPARHTRGR